MPVNGLHLDIYWGFLPAKNVGLVSKYCKQIIIIIIVVVVVVVVIAL
jgi:hypothetical protein